MLSFNLPQLNHICSYKFTSPYTRFNFDASNSLYLSSRSQDILSPDILYQSGSFTNRDVIPLDWNPSTQQYSKRASTNFFGSAVSNSDIALFTDFGEIPITNITYHSATTSSNTYLSVITIQPKHSYGLVISKPDIQAYVLIQVQDYVVDGDCDIQYAVLYYRVRNGLSHAESPNFNGDESPIYVDNGCSLQSVQVPYNKIERGVETAIVILSNHIMSIHY